MRRQPFVVFVCLFAGTCLLFAAACGSTAQGPKPGEVVAVGIATGIRDHGLARTTAQNRALSNLAQLLNADAVNVELWVAGGFSTLTVERPAGKIGMRQVDFTPLTNGWMARARARRSDVLMKRLQAMPTTSGTATVGGELSRALLIADARALRQAITAALPAPAADGMHRGKMTLVDRTVTFDADDAVRVTVKVHLKHESVDELTDAKRLDIIDAATNEYAALEEWQAAIQAKLARIETGGDDAKARTFIGEAYLALDEPLHAVEAFAAAAALEPTNKEHLERQLGAAERTKDEALVKKLSDELAAMAADEAKKTEAAAKAEEAKKTPAAKKKRRKRR